MTTDDSVKFGDQITNSDQTEYKQNVSLTSFGHRSNLYTLCEEIGVKRVTKRLLTDCFMSRLISIFLRAKITRGNEILTGGNDE